MRKNSLNKFLVMLPLLVLFFTLVFADYAVQLFKDTAYTFVYDTNAGSVIRFSREIHELGLQGYKGKEFVDFYDAMINVYNKTLGEKEAIITFLLKEDNTVTHSNAYNESHAVRLFENPDNAKLIKEAALLKESGKITLYIDDTEETFFYQPLSDGENEFRLFMGVDRVQIEKDLNVGDILIPICIIGIILLFCAEYIIWLKLKGAQK